MKTETLTIRITAADKKLISDLAWIRRISMAELIVSLARSAPEVSLNEDLEHCVTRSTKEAQG